MIATCVIASTSIASVLVILPQIYSVFNSLTTERTNLEHKIDNLTNTVHKQQQMILQFNESAIYHINHTK